MPQQDLQIRLKVEAMIQYAYAPLRKASLKRFKRRVRRLQRQYAARAVGLPDIQQQLSSWLAHARHGEALPAVAKFLNQHPFRRDT